MQRSVCILLAALPLLLGAGGTPLRPHNVLLSRLRTEPVVAIDPANPSLVVAGANTNYLPGPGGTFPAPFFTSHDGGSSFSVGTMPLPAPYAVGADTSVAIARDGTIFYSYLAESPTYCSNGPGAILLAHSVDHGLSFRGPQLVDSNPADDRPTLALESTSGSATHLFVAWTRSYPDHSEIWIVRSVDGGATFGPALRLYSSPLDNFGAEPVVGRNGQITVFWLSHRDIAPAVSSPAQVLLATSQDDGAHFQPARGAGRSFSTLPEMAHAGSLRDLTAPAAAAAPSGALYVAYAAVRGRHPDGSIDADIQVTRSLDEGVTWSKPERVNDSLHGDRFMPAVSVLSDGTLGVAFYDRRSGPGELDVYAARASFAHGFKVAPNVRVNSAPAPIADISYFKGDSAGDSCFPSGRFFGDYIGAVADSAQLAVVWAAPQAQQPSETDLWFARVALPVVSLPKRSSHAAPRVSGWAGFMAGPRSLLASLTGSGGHLPRGGMPAGQMLVICLILLLPALTIATALRTATGSRRA